MTLNVHGPVGLPTVDLARSASGYRWRLLAALWFVVAVVVALPSVGGGVLNAHMIQELQMDRGVYGLSFGVFVMMMGVPGPLVAAAVRRFGVRPVMLTGCAMVLAGALLIATVVQHGWQFALCFGVLIGGGVATAGVLPAQAAVTYWFHDKRALAVSIVLSAVDIGGIFAAPALEGVVAGHDWRSGWLLIAVLAGVGLLAITFTLRRDGGQEVGAPPIHDRPTQGRVHKTRRAWTFREAVRTPAFWCIAVFSTAVGIDWILFMAHGVIHLRDVGYTAEQAARAVAVLVSASLIGNLAAGALGDRVPPHRIGVVAMALMAVGLVLAAHPQGTDGLWFFAVPVGLGYGASQVCLMAMLGNYFGARAFPAVFGALLAAGTIAAAALAAGAGVTFEVIQTYGPVFYICAALSLVATLAVALAAPPRGDGDGALRP